MLQAQSRVPDQQFASDNNMCLGPCVCVVAQQDKMRNSVATITWSMLLVEAASDVQLFVMAFATQIKADFVWAVCAGVAPSLDWVVSTCITAHTAQST